MPTPFRCPVCEGKGIVPAGFYLTASGSITLSSTAPETCESCSGTGIVWNVATPVSTPSVWILPDDILTADSVTTCYPPKDDDMNWYNIDVKVGGIS